MNETNTHYNRSLKPDNKQPALTNQSLRYDIQQAIESHKQ